MPKKTIPVLLTITRDSHNNVRIELKCQHSRVPFTTVKLTPEQLGLAVTGYSYIEAPADVVGLEFVGKRKVIEDRTVTLDGTGLSREFFQNYLLHECQEPGWTIDTYLGSQGSVVANINTNKTTLRYSVYRYEDVPEGTPP